MSLFVSGREGGQGLGLWVTYQIVKQLNGSISVECRDGEIRFAISLPLMSDDAAEAKVGADEAPAQQGGRAKYALLAAADGETAPKLENVT